MYCNLKMQLILTSYYAILSSYIHVYIYIYFLLRSKGWKKEAIWESAGGEFKFQLSLISWVAASYLNFS